MKKQIPILVTLSLSLLAADALAQSAEDQARQQQEAIQQMMMRIRGMQGGNVAQPAPAPAAPAQAAMSEADLGASIANLPPVKGGVAFAEKKDGFEVNGQTFVDPEGPIVQFANNWETGDVTYALQGADGGLVLKFMRATTGKDPITIGRASESNGTWTVDTVTGKRLVGSRMLLSSRGVLVTRESTVFQYIAGTGISNFSAQDGFHVADFQHGDVSATGYVLLERNPPEQSNAGGLFSSLKSIGSSLGINKKEDYVLVSLADKKAFPMNITLESKSTGFYSNCKQVSPGLNKCKNATFRESLYDQNGFRNMGHYYWRTYWMRSPKGPLLIAQENGLSDITVTDLTTGKKVLAFNRTLGIADFDVSQAKDGTIKLSAQMGLTRENIPDLLAFMDKAPAVTTTAEAEPEKKPEQTATP